MLTDPKAIEIISEARQKNVRDPNRSRKHFERIYRDFLKKVDFEGDRLLDLGPGQFDFARMARERGAETYGIDKDPAVVELGGYLGFPVRQGELTQLDAGDWDIRFDGVFCKFSINAFWFEDDDEHVRVIREIGRLLKHDGWSWIGPWNGVPKRRDLTDTEIRHALQVQTETFKDLGYRAFELTDELSARYGIHGSTANRALFIRNLDCPRKVRKLETL